jgi:hypothetical protein
MRNGARFAAFLAAVATFIPSATAGVDVAESRGSVTKSALQRIDTGARSLADRILGHGTPHRASYPNGPGWTQAQVKRMARKRRNVARNRRAHR